jgi:hypothetical protein
MTVLIAIAGALLATTSPEPPEDWVAITGTDAVVIGVDRGSVRHAGDIATFDAMNAWLHGTHGDYAISEVRIDCVSRTFQVGDRTTYEADGATIATFTTPGPVASFGPTTTMGDVSRAVCDGTWPGNFSAPAHADFYRMAVEAMRGD